jgi:hypothetical protein
MDGRKKYIKVKGVLMPLSQARALEKSKTSGKNIRGGNGVEMPFDEAVQNMPDDMIRKVQQELNASNVTTDFKNMMNMALSNPKSFTELQDKITQVKYRPIEERLTILKHLFGNDNLVNLREMFSKKPKETNLKFMMFNALLDSNTILNAQGKEYFDNRKKIVKIRSNFFPERGGISITTENTVEMERLMVLTHWETIWVMDQIKAELTRSWIGKSIVEMHTNLQSKIVRYRLTNDPYRNEISIDQFDFANATLASTIDFLIRIKPLAKHFIEHS